LYNFIDYEFISDIFVLYINDFIEIPLSIEISPLLFLSVYNTVPFRLFILFSSILQITYNDFYKIFIKKNIFSLFMDLYYISVVLFPESRLCEKYITILFIFLYLIFERKLLRKLSILYFVFLEFLYFLSFFRIFACIFLDFKKIHRFLISLIQVVIILLHIN